MTDTEHTPPLDLDELRYLHTWLMRNTSVSIHPMKETSRTEWEVEMYQLLVTSPSLLTRLEQAEQERDEMRVALRQIFSEMRDNE